MCSFDNENYFVNCGSCLESKLDYPPLRKNKLYKEDNDFKYN